MAKHVRHDLVERRDSSPVNNAVALPGHADVTGRDHGHSQHGNTTVRITTNLVDWLARCGLTAFTAALIHPAHSRRMENRWWAKATRPLAKSDGSTLPRMSGGNVETLQIFDRRKLTPLR